MGRSQHTLGPLWMSFPVPPSHSFLSLTYCSASHHLCSLQNLHWG